MRQQVHLIITLNKLSENMTVITIAHRLSTIQNSDIIYVMNNGKITEFGNHRDLINLKGEYYELYTKQRT